MALGRGEVARRWRRVAAALTVGIVVLAATVVIVELGTGSVPAVSALGSGAAWISTTTGGLDVNGASGEPQEGLRFACPSAPSPCSWVQSDTMAYVLDAGAGSARRVDAAALTLGPPVSVGAPEVTLAAGGGRVYAVDRDLAAIRQLDPVTLQVESTVVLDDAPSGIVVDRQGWAWVAASRAGAVFGIHDGVVAATLVAGSLGDQLSLGTRDGGVFVVNGAAGTIATVSSGGLRDVTSLGQVGRALIAGRDLPVGPAYVLDATSGVIIAVDLGRGDAQAVATIRGSGHYAPPVAAGSRVVVLDTTSHVPHVVDATSQKEEPALDHATEVLCKDGFVYVNDPAGKASVLDPTGRRIPVDRAKAVAEGGDGTPGANAAQAKAGAAGTSAAGSKAKANPRATAKANPKSTAKPTAKPKPKRSAKINAKALATGKASPKPAALPKTDGPATSGPTPKAPPVLHTTAPPARPNAPAVIAGDHSAVVSWEAPVGNPTGYRVLADSGEEQDATPGDAACDSATRTCTFGDLTNGQAYTFTVTAYNAHGSSAASAPSRPVVPSADPPAAPSGVTAALGSQPGTVTLTWADTDPTVTAYTVVPNDGTDDIATADVAVGATAHAATVTGLLLGQAYRFRVQAATKDGATSLSDFSDTVTPVGRAGAMSAIMVELADHGLGATTATLTWTDVEGNGLPVSYIVKDAGGAVLATTTDTAYTVTGVIPGDRARVTVTPTNSAGDGTPGSADIVSFIDLASGPSPLVTFDLTEPTVAVETGAATGSAPTYDFTYTIRATGKAACLPTADLVITPAAGAVQDLPAEHVCLATTDTYTFKASAPLTSGAYTFQAEWSDVQTPAVLHPYGPDPAVAHDLTVP